MQIANTAALDAERMAILYAFDAVWTPSCEEWSPRALRALRCARRLADAGRDFGCNTIIGRGWRITAPAVIRA
jgi:hypothetical protein